MLEQVIDSALKMETATLVLEGIVGARRHLEADISDKKKFNPDPVLCYKTFIQDASNVAASGIYHSYLFGSNNSINRRPNRNIEWGNKGGILIKATSQAAKLDYGYQQDAVLDYMLVPKDLFDTVFADAKDKPWRFGFFMNYGRRHTEAAFTTHPAVLAWFEADMKKLAHALLVEANNTYGLLTECTTTIITQFGFLRDARIAEADKNHEHWLASEAHKKAGPEHQGRAFHGE
jgi:hypothetical protein